MIRFWAQKPKGFVFAIGLETFDLSRLRRGFPLEADPALSSALPGLAEEHAVKWAGAPVRIMLFYADTRAGLLHKAERLGLRLAETRPAPASAGPEEV